MKRILHSSSVFTFLVTALLCGPAFLFATNNPLTPSNIQKNNSGFIENKGQIVDLKNKSNPSVLYLLNTPGFNVQLRALGWSYDVYQQEPSDTPPLAVRYSSFATETKSDKTNSEQRKAFYFTVLISL